MNSNKAVKTGLVLVVSSALIFMILGLITGTILFIKYNFHIAFIIVSLCASLIIYWPFWSFLLVKWKLWSFRNVDDFKMLIELAEKQALFYPEDHFYSRHEFCGKTDKKLLKELYSKRIKENSVETLLERYKSKTITIWPGITRIFNNTPLLRINIKGLWFRSTGLIEWHEFSSVKAKTTGGKYPSYWIEYKLRGDKNIYEYRLTNMWGNYLSLEFYLKTYKKITTTNCHMAGGGLTGFLLAPEVSGPADQIQVTDN